MTKGSASVLDAITERFEARRDPERAAAMTAYMRGQFAFIGIANPERVALLRDATANCAELDERDLIDVGRATWARDERDYQYAGCWLMHRQVEVLTPTFLPTAEWLITTKSWWDTVDELVKVVVGPIVKSHPEQRSLMDAWLESDNFWLARVAILHQERWKADTDAEWLFAACVRRAGDTEFFVRKAIGWALRSYSYTDPVAVERFVTDHHHELSGLSRREALKAIERSRRA